MPLLTTDMNITGALKKAGLIPELIVEGFSPSTLLEIKYPSGQDVALGNRLKEADAAQRPSVFFVPPDETAAYTLVMVNPDVPSATDNKFGPWRHWVVVNISGSNLADIQEDSRQQLPYIGPGADPNTGDHRYVFLLYKQASHDYTFPDMSYPVIPNRRNSDVKRFAIEKELELVAANYFICAAKEE